MGINSYSKTAGSNNATPPNGWPEGMAPSDVNNSARQNMADLRTWYENPQWLDLGGTLTYVTTNQFRVVNSELGSDLTGIYEIGRLIKVTDGSSNVVYGVITASSYSAPNTTVTVAPFSGSFTSINKAELSAQTRTGAAFGAIPVRQNAQTGTTYTFLTDDWGKLVTFNNASAVAVTLPQANSTTFQAGWSVEVANLGAGAVTITPTTSTIDGAATLVLSQGQGCKIISNGSNYFSVKGAQTLPSGGPTWADFDDTFVSAPIYQPAGDTNIMSDYTVGAWPMFFKVRSNFLVKLTLSAAGANLLVGSYAYRGDSASLAAVIDNEVLAGTLNPRRYDACVIDEANGRILVTWDDGTNGVRAQVVECDASGNLSSGTALTVQSNTSSRNGAVVCIDTNKVIHVYHDAALSKGRGTVLSISGTTITNGTPGDINGSNALSVLTQGPACLSKINTEYALLGYAYGGTPTEGVVMVRANGTTFSAGTTVNTGGTAGRSVAVAALTSALGISCANNGGSNISVRVLTLDTGTQSVTLNTAAAEIFPAISVSGVRYKGFRVADNAGIFLVDGNSTNYQEALAVTVSGTTPTLEGTVNLNNPWLGNFVTTQRSSMQQLDSNTFAFAVDYDNASGSNDVGLLRFVRLPKFSQ